MTSNSPSEAKAVTITPAGWPVIDDEMICPDSPPLPVGVVPGVGGKNKEEEENKEKREKRKEVSGHVWCAPRFRSGLTVMRLF